MKVFKDKSYNWYLPLNYDNKIKDVIELREKYKETSANDIKEKIETILNNKRTIMLQQMLSGNVDYEELLFQIDEEIREVLKDSDDNER